MTAQERGPFEKQAKDSKVGPKKEVEKYTSQGIPLSVIEKEQKQLEHEHRTMMRTIQSTVVDAFTNNSEFTSCRSCDGWWWYLVWLITQVYFPFFSNQEIASQEFIFISGNYFINVDENYLPAEIAMVRFSFENGIVSKFHSYVDPGKLTFPFIHITKRSATRKS